MAASICAAANLVSPRSHGLFFGRWSISFVLAMASYGRGSPCISSSLAITSIAGITSTSSRSASISRKMRVSGHFSGMHGRLGDGSVSRPAAVCGAPYRGTSISDESRGTKEKGPNLSSPWSNSFWCHIFGGV